MRSIIHQQLNMSFANTLSMRFVESFGSHSDGVWHYPSPERIASLDVSVFGTCSLARGRRNMLLEFHKR